MTEKIQGAELAVTQPNAVTASPMNQWAVAKEQATILIESGMLPDVIKTVPQALAIIMKGQEIGIPPMQSFSQIHIIKGKPCVSAELMLGLIKKHNPGVIVSYPTYTDEKVTIRVTQKWIADEFTWTKEDAKRAGLLSNSTWQKYPKAMLRSRAISEMARSKFPEAIMGCSYTPEEMGAEVSIDETGGTITIDAATDTPVTETFYNAANLEHAQHFASICRKEFSITVPEEMKKLSVQLDGKVSYAQLPNAIRELTTNG